ncbi:MAG: histidine kinase [Deltaproteobacteria bacterium RIFCSPLOWO2_12_FULL_43_16]|nr:MAG: histidine kinase [Deltaproteobacteria bacterium GWA2_43_19]OGQ12278.1 MAG: histidine kinase [Deltaproteobacteria bacterium RIFCSPHIGHO2_02_FULL_43_33]OGQ61658.1 MAG: histidine kinase [Deltaproteobacteria bacterium RIFCSPLOWO2_12_FULL_43_16]
MEFITRCRKCGKKMKSERVDDYRVKLVCSCGFWEFKTMPTTSKAINPYYPQDTFSHIKIDEKGGIVFEMERANREKMEIMTLEEISMLASSDYDLNEVLQSVVEKTAKRLGVDVSSIYLWDGKELVLRATTSFRKEAIGKVRLKLGEGITGSAAKERKPIIVKDVSKDPRYKRFAELREQDYTTMLSHPIIHKGELFGVLNVQTIAPKDFQEDEMYFVSVIANMLLSAIMIRKKV